MVPNTETEPDLREYNYLLTYLTGLTWITFFNRTWLVVK